MTAAAAPYGALTLAVTKAASLAANQVVVGILDEFNRGRQYLPFAWGYIPQTGDAANKWLPSVGSVTVIQDPAGQSQTGQYLVTLIPGSADAVNVASVQTIRVDSNAMFLTATSTW